MIKVSQELFLQIRNYKEFDFNYTYNVLTKELERGVECFYFICKEWSYNQGYTIDIYNKNDGLYIEVSKHILGRYLYKSLLFDLNDEQNELIKACQWILDNKEL